MPELGRAALLVTLGLSVYALVAGVMAAHLGRRRLARSAQNALVASFATTAVAAAVLLSALLRNDFSFSYVANTTSEALPTAVHDLGVLGRAGGLAAALAARADRLRCGSGEPEPKLGTRSDRVGRPGLRRGLDVLRVPRRGRGKPVRDSGRARGRRGHDAEPAEPVHARPSTAAVPRLRGPHRALRVRNGGVAVGEAGRALAHRDAALDALRVGGARDRPAPGQPLGVRRGRLGRLLRVGSGGERGSHAVARGDRVPALGDDPGATRDAEGLERPARDPRVLALALRDVPHALRAS